MKIFHKKKLIANKVKLCDAFFSKSKGLMFSRRLRKRDALIFVADREGRMETTIHMFFVFFAIDVVWLDKDKKVVDKRENIKPFTPLIIPEKPAEYVVELPKNTARHINRGDILKFVDR